MAAIVIYLNIEHSFIMTSDIKKNRPNYAKKVLFMVMASSMTSQGDLKVFLYIHV